MKRASLAIALVAGLFVSSQLGAEHFSARYDFSPEKWIRLGAKAGSLELQDIEFQLPAYVGPRKLGIKGRNQATLNLKNYGDTRMRVQVAIALFDSDGNLVGCGTTGTKMVGTKPGDAETFFVSFDYVNERIGTAKTFYLTVETAPDVPEVSGGNKAPKGAG
jgi:hypothetical protein